MIPPFPRIPHLPGSHAASDDLVLGDDETTELLGRELVAVEKLDGINVAVMLGRRELIVDVKPAWRRVLAEPVGRGLQVALRQREAGLARLLRGGAVLYCEWLWHTVSLEHTTLPDVVVGFAVRDGRGRLLPVDEARARIADVGLTPSVLVWRGRMERPRDAAVITRIAARSRVPVEGLVFEQARPGRLRFAKWVDGSYRHVRAGSLRGGHNRLAPGACRPVVWLPGRDARR